MRDNSYDRTIERNYLQKWRFLIPEYEAVKAGRSKLFKRVGDFYRHHGTCSQTFRKYYNRYLQSGDEADLLPRRRGPKWRERREPEGIEAEIVACRQKGMNRYEIHAVLRERRDTIPSPSTIYRVLTRYGLNRRTPAMREEKRRIIKDKLGELGHVDLHQLPRDMFLAPPPATAYIVSLIDSCSRLAWAEVLTSKKALPAPSSPPAPSRTSIRSRPCCSSSASNTATPGPIGRRPTARSNASGARSMRTSSRAPPSTISTTSPTNCSST
ncbi:hypothetical protein V1286_006393 [Bradyrhizobium algeriense]|uniref:Transposase n=1 Tax=Bradyrhizobium algeriense TaxID=634784 RepID=A0ABU8B2A5_9BRAD